MSSVRRAIDLPAPPSEVWAALERAELFSLWFGAQVELEPRAGGHASFRSPDGSERTAVVEVVDVPRLLLLRFLPLERDATGAIRQRPGGRMRFLLRENESGGTRFEVEDATGSGLALAGGAR
jgi:uncharacterized protein YndB with AHSA1/START domain